MQDGFTINLNSIPTDFNVEKFKSRNSQRNPYVKQNGSNVWRDISLAL